MENANNNPTTVVSRTSIKPLIIILAISFCGYFAAYLTTVLLTRALGAVSYSSYISTISMISMLALCLLLGVDQGLNKYIPEFLSQKNVSAAAAYLRYSRERTWIQLVVVLVVGILCFFLIHHLISQHMIPDKDSSLILAFLWVVPLYAVMWYFGNLLQAGGYGYGAVFLLFGIQPLGMLIILTTCRALHIHINMLTATYCYVAVTVVGALIGIMLSKQKQLILKDDKKFQVVRDEWSKVTRNLFLLLLVSLCSAFLIIILSQAFSRNIRAAGILGVLTIICNVFNPISNGVYALLSAKISTAVATKDSKRVRKILISGIIGSLIPSVIGLFIIIFFGKVWLGHFGKDYVDSYLPLILMASTVFINTLLTPFLWLVQFSTNLSNITRMAVIFFILFVGISIPLDYFYDVIGAIIGFAFLQIGYWIYLMIVVFKNWQKLFVSPVLSSST